MVDMPILSVGIFRNIYCWFTGNNYKSVMKRTTKLMSTFIRRRMDILKKRSRQKFDAAENNK